eukprot:g3189.t1
MGDMKKRIYGDKEGDDDEKDIRIVKTASLTTIAKLGSVNLIVLCSVVPLATMEIRKFADNRSIRVVSEPTLETCASLGLRVCYASPSRLGKDRLAAALYAHHLCNSRSDIDAVVIVDAGTAVNVEVVTKDKGYLGGAILPGLGMMSSSLQTGTAQLNISSTDLPKHAIGTSTESCLQSGVVLGFLGAVERVVERIVQDLARLRGDKKESSLVLSSGGDGQFVCDNLECVGAFRASLVLDGIERSYLGSLE